MELAGVLNNRIAKVANLYHIISKLHIKIKLITYGRHNVAASNQNNWISDLDCQKGTELTKL